MPEKIAFHVVHASGQDENFKAAELNTHSPLTRGWSSSRFCLYPQDIVIQLEKRCRLRKIQVLSHQYLIASRVEFFVGDIPPDMPVTLNNSRYTRLGYVALSSNEQTDYKARELKSVHVDAVGIYLKLVIHKNHVNKCNLYNQVGVIAINVIGDDLDKVNQDEDPSISTQKPDFISPLDDLAFDMYQDMEVAQIIRKLEMKKQDSVLSERYDYAKKLKQIIVELQKVGEKLGKYEVDKRQAVEQEDYDKAKLKKVQMEEYRLQMYKKLDIPTLLQDAPKSISNKSPRVDPPPARLKEIPSPPVPRAPVNRPSQPSPLPAVQNSGKEPLVRNSPSPRQVEAVDRDERALPVPKQSYNSEPANDEPESAVGGQTDRSDANGGTMSEKDLREAGFVIDIFGLPLVQKAYARNWGSKEESMTDLVDRLAEFSGDREDAKAMMKAATFLIQKMLKDSVYLVFKATINALKYLLTEFVPKHKIPKHDIHYTCEKTLPGIMHKTGDTAARTRTDAKAQIIDMSQYPELTATHVVSLFCVRPFKLNTAPRLAQSYVEVVDELYSTLPANDGGLTVDSMMKFCVNALQHHSGQVRTPTENLIIKLYKQHGHAVKSYLPPDDDKTRRNTLYRQLFEAFDVIDGKPSKRDLEKQRQADEAAKKAEVEALQQQIAQMKALQSNIPGGQKKGKKNAAQPQPDDDAISSITKFDRTCIFCNEQNDDFTEEGLDLHYWKSCPMLKRCSNCKQVVEIASLTEHLLTECEAKGNYSKCPRCTEAIPKPEFDEHVKSKACHPADSKKSRCPLCHENITNGDASWTEHLMSSSPSACKQNPRRLTAQYKNKSKPGGKKAPAAGAKGRGAKPGRR